jgi:Flp pilus assembly pilin Flp
MKIDYELDYDKIDNLRVPAVATGFRYSLSLHFGRRLNVKQLVQKLWNDQEGQDIAEYAVMLAVILVIVVGTIRLIGSNANNVFSSVGSAIQ